MKNTQHKTAPKNSIDLTQDDMMGETAQPSQLQTAVQSSQSKESETTFFSQERFEIETLSEKLKTAENKLLHAFAEMENVRKRADQRIADAHKYGVSKLLEELVPILDSLEQSQTVHNGEQAQVKNMRKGMALILQMLLKILEKFGVKEINPVNKEVFNPEWHEVMLAQENADHAPNTIISVMQKGYQLHERLIRPARVLIAKAAV